MASDQAHILAIADRYARAFADRDIDAIAALYDDDLQVFHNFTGMTQTKTENVEFLRNYLQSVSSAHYSDIVRHTFSNGYVEQHVVEAVLPGGRALPPTPACLVVHITGDKIACIAEYVDPWPTINAFAEAGDPLTIETAAGNHDNSPSAQPKLQDRR